MQRHLHCNSFLLAGHLCRGVRGANRVCEGEHRYLYAKWVVCFAFFRLHSLEPPTHARTDTHSGMKSWNHTCTYNTDCPKESSCTGCTIDAQRQEPFPVFPALLNAIHERGVKIRMLTNNFTFSACNGRTVPLDWLALNKIEIRMYSTTTFLHTKFISIDNKMTAVSSVNWSPTSFLRNREAGVILEDCTCSVLSLYQSVFEYDWDKGMDYVVTRQYTDTEVKRITDTAYMPYHIISGSVKGFVTQLIPHEKVEVKKVYATPDHARDTLMNYLNATRQSLNVSLWKWKCCF